MQSELCPICNRILGEINTSKHHLIPKSKGGKDTPTVLLHNICHQKIHSVFTEKELRDYYNSIEKLLSHEDIIKFVKWVTKKDPAFYQSNRTTNKKRNR